VYSEEIGSYWILFQIRSTIRIVHYLGIPFEIALGTSLTLFRRHDRMSLFSHILALYEL
jgi:hypothetical protein